MVSHRLLNLLPHVFVSTSKQNHMHQLDIDGKSAESTFHLHIFSPKIMALGVFCNLSESLCCFFISNWLFIAFTGVFTLCCGRNSGLYRLYSCCCEELWDLSFDRWICECLFMLAICAMHAANSPGKCTKPSCVGMGKQEMRIITVALHTI